MKKLTRMDLDRAAEERRKSLKAMTNGGSAAPAVSGGDKSSKIKICPQWAKSGNCTTNNCPHAHYRSDRGVSAPPAMAAKGGGKGRGRGGRGAAAKAPAAGRGGGRGRGNKGGGKSTTKSKDLKPQKETGPAKDGSNPQAQPCRDWKKNGSCPRGDKCPYWHVGICGLYNKNRAKQCPYGNSCRYRHVLKEPGKGKGKGGQAQAATPTDGGKTETPK